MCHCHCHEDNHVSCFSHMTHSTTSRARPYCSEIRKLDCTRPAPSWHHLLAKDFESKASRATGFEPMLLRIDRSITSISWSSSPQCSVRLADNNRCSLNVLWSRSLTTLPIFLSKSPSISLLSRSQAITQRSNYVETARRPPKLVDKTPMSLTVATLVGIWNVPP